MCSDMNQHDLSCTHHEFRKMSGNKKWEQTHHLGNIVLVEVQAETGSWVQNSSQDKNLMHRKNNALVYIQNIWVSREIIYLSLIKDIYQLKTIQLILLCLKKNTDERMNAHFSDVKTKQKKEYKKETKEKKTKTTKN